MRIYHDPLNSQFTILPNQTLRDKNLSLKSKGLLGLMLSNKDGFNCTIESIKKQCRDGKDSIQAGLKELKECGYLKYDRERARDGTLRTILIVSNIPRFAENPQNFAEEMADLPADGKPGRRCSRQTVNRAALEDYEAKNQSKNTTTTGGQLCWPPGMNENAKNVVVAEIEGLEQEQQQVIIDLLGEQLAKGRRPTHLGPWAAKLTRASLGQAEGPLVVTPWAKEAAQGRARRAAEAQEAAARQAEAAARAARAADPAASAKSKAAATAAFEAYERLFTAD